MRRIFRVGLTLWPYKNMKCQYSKSKADLMTQSNISKHSLFSKKSFNEIISILKNPDNPYPRNSAYYNAILQSILDESTTNNKVMIDYGQIIHGFLQDVMDRIKQMSSKELSDVLSLLRFRPKALRFQKQLLITMHVRFQTRIRELIQLNQLPIPSTNPDEIITMQDVKFQLEGLFYLKKNTTILKRVLNFSHQMIQKKHLAISPQDNQALEQLKQQQNIFFSIIYTVNQNLDDTIDPVRESISEFIQENYKNKTLPYNKQILRMIVKCKFYKNYPLVRNQDWLHQYVYQYLQKIIKQQQTTDIEQFVSVLKSVINYSMHIDPWSRQGFLQLIQTGYKIAKRNLLSISYINDKQQLAREVNTISLQIKLIPSYLMLKHYNQINTVQVQDGNKVDNRYIQSVIEQIKPLVKKFILCYFEKTQIQIQGGYICTTLTTQIKQNINILNNIVKNQQDPQKILLKSVQNLLNIVTVFKDYHIIKIDPQFSLLLIQAQVIYCILCRQWITDQVRYLRLLQHSVFVISELERQLQLKNPQFVKHAGKIKYLKTRMQEQLGVYDNVEKNYKQFTILRLVAIFKCMNMKAIFLEDVYKNIKLKKPNVYVQTLSRTMLKIYNYDQVIQSFQLMFQGKIPVKQIQLGRIVFLSSKQPQLLKYWMYRNRKLFVSKICFCRRVINNIVSIIRMDNLQINRNSIQILSQIVIENKLFEIQNNSISNHQQSNALKKILCNNFSILFRYSKMDSMIDDTFIVNKNIPTIFRNKFSHIEILKILTFSAYLSEEQSIFYVNRQNKNALFKYVIMLMRKQQFCQKNKKHYLLQGGYSEQSIILNVVDKIIQQYWPDNKLTNKGMPFYAQFLNFYIQIDHFQHLIRNQNTIFLIIKEILQDYRQVQNKAELKYIISRLENNYERLHILTMFQNQANINNTLENVLSSMNFVMDLKIFSEFVKYIEREIQKEIDLQREKIKNYNKDSQNSSYSAADHQIQSTPWKNQNGVCRYLVNILAMQNLTDLNQFSDFQVLSLFTLDIVTNGTRKVLTQNMKLVIRRLLKVNPCSIKTTTSDEQRKTFPFQLFKIVISNINLYLINRQKRTQIGQQLIDDDINNQKITQWLIKCLLTYCKDIYNNEQIQYISRFLNNWNIDILSLVYKKFIDMRLNLTNLANSYFDVEILSLFFSQNLITFNTQNSIPDTHEFSNHNIIAYIRIILKEFEQTHLMNNYGVYFQQQGQKVLDIIKSLLIMIMENEKPVTKLFKQANQQFKIVKQLFQEFNRISSKTSKYNKLRSGGKYSYLFNQNQGDVVDMAPSTSLRKRSPYSGDTSESQSVSLKLFSTFSQILEIISLVRFSKWSAKNFNTTHQQQVKKISGQISKRQKNLLLHSQLTYFRDSQPLIQQKTFQQFNLKLYVLNNQSQNKQQHNQLTVLYIANQNQSMLYDFSYKKRKRITGEQQIIVNYIESLISVSQQVQNKKQHKIQVKVIPQHLNKNELRKLLLGN